MQTVEEKFDQDVWAVLQKIKEHQLYWSENEKDKNVRFYFSSSEWDDPKIIEYQILGKLELWGVIKNRKDSKSASEFEIIEPKFSILYNSYGENGETKIGGLIEIYYQKEAGIGTINGKNFKLRTETKRRVFGELYDHINKEVTRQNTLILIGFYDKTEKPDKMLKSRETYAINDVVKDLRDNTGLTTGQLVNNGGNLTLIGNKKEPK